MKKLWIIGLGPGGGADLTAAPGRRWKKATSSWAIQSTLTSSGPSSATRNC